MNYYIVSSNIPLKIVLKLEVHVLIFRISMCISHSTFFMEYIYITKILDSKLDFGLQMVESSSPKFFRIENMSPNSVQTIFSPI